MNIEAVKAAYEAAVNEQERDEQTRLRYTIRAALRQRSAKAEKLAAINRDRDNLDSEIAQIDIALDEAKIGNAVKLMNIYASFGEGDKCCVAPGQSQAFNRAPDGPAAIINVHG